MIRREKKHPGITIRQRLSYSFALVALLPAIAISLGAIVLGYYNGKQQVLDRLSSVASLKEMEISTWLEARHNELIFLSSSSYNPDRIETVLKLSAQEKYYDFFFKALQNTFLRLVASSDIIVDLSLVNPDGKVVLSSNDMLQGTSFSGESFFLSGLHEKTAQLWFDESEHGRLYIVTSIPLSSAQGESEGMLISRCKPDDFESILRESTGLGTGGEAFLVTSRRAIVNANVLSGTEAPGLAESENMISLSQNILLPDIYANASGNRVIGVQRWIASLETSLAVTQDLEEAFSGIYTNLGVNLAIAIVSLFLAIILSLGITGSISAPLINLSKTAACIAAGDLDQTVQLTQNDEIGELGQSFNSMTRQLRELINDLENRVQERTQALQRRALQLETSSQVSREITSILDIDDLLERIVERICTSFGYYNVNIFLVEKEDKMILRASSHPGATPPIILEKNNSSLNGKAAIRNQSILISAANAGFPAAGTHARDPFRACHPAAHWQAGHRNP